MDIYLFSYHAPDPEMIKELGTLTAQIKGEISNIHSQYNLISFTETLFIGGQKIKVNHTIPADSIVIVDAPPILQEDWLAAGISTLLVPQTHEEPGPWGLLTFKYAGLLQVHKIEIVTSFWNNRTTEVYVTPIVHEEKQKSINSSASFSIANLLQKLGWKPLKQNFAPW